MEGTSLGGELVMGAYLTVSPLRTGGQAYSHAQGRLSSLEPALDPHCGCLGNAPGRRGACLCEGRRSHRCPSFQWSICDTISIRLSPIILYISMRQYQLQDLAISSISSLSQVVLGAGTLCALGQEIVQDISWLPNLIG